jgi:hypothetical protein
MTDPITVFVAAAIGGFASALVSNIRNARQRKRELERVRQIILAEYTYWRDEDDGADHSKGDLIPICTGAMGALSNVLAALEGIPQTHHRRQRSETCHTSQP